MKEYYTDIEKKMVNYFVDHYQEKILFYEFIAKNMDAVAIELLADDSFAIVSNQDLEIKEYSKAERSVIDIICFIEYLLKENLITLFAYSKDQIDSNTKAIRIYDREKYKYNETIDSPQKDNLSLEEFFAAIKSGRYTVPIKENGRQGEAVLYGHKLISQGSISDFIKGNFNTFMYPSTLLIELANSKFKTPEQIRFETQLDDTQRKHKEIMCKTRWALGISFAGLVTALILPFCTKTTLAEKDEIINSIQSVKTEFPTVIKTKITNDTIKVDVVKPTPIKKK